MIESKVVAVFRILFVAVGCLGILCCSGEGHSSLPGVPETPEVPVDPDALCEVLPGTIEIGSVDVSETPLTRSATGEPEQKVEYSANLGHNFSVEGTLEAEPQTPHTRAAVSLGNDVQYRMVVFDASNNVVGNVVYKVGSTKVVSGTAIKLQAGTYRLFCYSFNSTSAIPDLESDNQNVTVKAGEDFMTYTEAPFTIGSSDYTSGKKVTINFVRQCAKLTVTVIADGYTDNTIIDASLSLSSMFGDNKWNGVSNADDASMTAASGTISLIKGSADGVSVDCGKDGSTPYACVVPFTGQTITATNLTVNIRGKEVTVATISFPKPVTLVKGGSYQLTINLHPYYTLTKTNPVTIGGIKWARTNLQQSGSGNSASVSFVANPWDYGSYWSWGMRDATSSTFLSGDVHWTTTTPSHANQDPCCSLGSGWRLPKKDDLQSILSHPAPAGVKVKINGTINTITGSCGWAPDAKCAILISDGQVLSLPAAGYRGANDLISSQGSLGYYWTSTPGSGNSACNLGISSGTLIVYSASGRGAGSSLRCLQE